MLDFILDDCIDFLYQNSYKNIVLQFPDTLLHLSISILSKIKHELLLASKTNDISISILADTSYGSCCVDDVAAKHVNADCIVHFGYSCLSALNGNIPCFYVFGNETSNLDLFFEGLSVSSITSKVVVFSPVFKASLETFFSTSTLQNLFLASPKYTVADSASMHVNFSGRVLPPDVSDHGKYEFVFLLQSLDQDSRLLYLFQLRFPLHKYSVFVCGNDSEEGRWLDPAELRGPRSLLGMRMSLIEKIKNASTIGILVGTLGNYNYLETIQKLRKLIAFYGKRPFTIGVGKLNGPKLGNFLDIDCFVLVACPESTLTSQVDFMVPVISPYELLLAFTGYDGWQGHIELDFKNVEIERFFVGKSEQEDASSIDSLCNTSSSNTVSCYYNTDFIRKFKERTFKGLEQNTECKGLSIHDGRSGIAKDYH